MSHPYRAFILIEKGEPYRKGTVIPIAKKKVSIGRRSIDNKSDISFSDPFISHDHLSLEWKEGSYRAFDKNSKNGTKINDQKLKKSTYHRLVSGDLLNLANDAVILLFSYDDTSTTLSHKEATETLDIIFNAERRELSIAGQKINIQGKTYELFSLLYEKRGKVVSHQEIKTAVWQERPLYTSEEEIHMLMMRLRQKMGDSSRFIHNIRGYGYILDI